MVYRIDVAQAALARGGESSVDPLGQAIRHQIQEFGAEVGPISTRRIFLIDTSASEGEVQRIATELLADPIVESAELIRPGVREDGRKRIEIHLKPGVMDPVAASTMMAIRDMGLPVNEVRTGRAYLIEGATNQDELHHIASKILANDVVESIHFEPYVPSEFKTLKEPRFEIRQVPLRKLGDQELAKLSREGHLFLSLTEMRAIQNYFRAQDREPTDIELETLAQTWSEHCVHKTLKSAVDVEVRDESGKTVQTRRYQNLIKETIFDSTMQLMKTASSSPERFCLSVFKDNAGVVAFDDTDAVCFKVETHNHPSAIEPYGGSATGVGGVIRDILGTGLAAKPVANTDVFCVAHPSVKGRTRAMPKGIIHPRRILQQVVAGVRDYGNRMGIPTINGAVYFDDNYIGNPLVFCGCIGLIPRNKIEKDAQTGDAIVVMGGRTGRDGIHGATFSSAELTDTHADEFSHAVQIGNAITQKKMADVILQARDRNLFNAITDCGAGGLSSAVGEMGEKVGAEVHLDKVPLKYAGLKYDEIWISEAQERMVLSVPREKIDDLLRLAKGEDVEATVIGTFGTAKHDLVLNYKEKEVGRLSMEFVHHGIPMPTRRAVISARGNGVSVKQHGRDAHATREGFRARLLKQLAHPNIASKHWIVRQYDHEVQGGSVVKPLTGPLQVGPSDASVVRPKLSSFRGVAVACGLAPHIDDPYRMAVASIDEAIRNAVCVGADPDRIAILDNFCWPSCEDELTMGTLVRACEACRDAALAYRIPFISGKDSLHNQFTIKETGQVIRIPPTLLISAIGVLDDVRKCVTMDLKISGASVVLVAAKEPENLESLAETHRRVAAVIRDGKVAAAHDISEGGYAIALAEMCIASGLGIVTETQVMFAPEAFEERNGAYLLELREKTHVSSPDLRKQFGDVATVSNVGLVQQSPNVTITQANQPAVQIGLEELTQAWRGTLDW